MKTKIFPFAVVVAFTTGRSLLAGDADVASRAGALLPPATAHACCAVEKPAAPKAACCTAASAPALAAGEVAAVSDRSLYQLEATWTNDAGQPVTLASLRGRPVVLTMFFASCRYACPILVGDMQRLRDALPTDVREKAQFVLVSFDTVRDTPAALQAYRVRAALDPASWTLLRGEAADVQELAMLLGVKYKQDARGEFSHSNLITVLNAAGEIVHQRGGLQGEVAEAARAVSLAAQ